jgi:hypothetical protein
VNNNNYSCVLSGSLLWIPFIVYWINTEKNNYENVLALLLFVNIILTNLFWTNPIKNSYIHKYDSIAARLSYIAFPIYILFIKNIGYEMKLLFLIVLLSSLFMIYHSDICSKGEWCSQEHIKCHTIFHLMSSIGSSIAFI